MCIFRNGWWPYLLCGSACQLPSINKLRPLPHAYTDRIRYLFQQISRLSCFKEIFKGKNAQSKMGKKGKVKEVQIHTLLFYLFLYHHNLKAELTKYLQVKTSDQQVHLDLFILLCKKKRSKFYLTVKNVLKIVLL